MEDEATFFSQLEFWLIGSELEECSKDTLTESWNGADRKNDRKPKLLKWQTMLTKWTELFDDLRKESGPETNAGNK